MKYRPLEDSATSHRANATVCTRLRQNTTDFIRADEWASSSPDLNPLDYCTWDIMQYLVYEADGFRVQIHRTAKRQSKNKWKEVTIETVRKSIARWKND